MKHLKLGVSFCWNDSRDDSTQLDSNYPWNPKQKLGCGPPENQVIFEMNIFAFSLVLGASGICSSN